MLFTRMDLLNAQFLDKMNNNIGRLHYEDESRTSSLPSAMSGTPGPPPNCPSKRKYGEEQAEDRLSCDDDHMTKMSRLFATQLARPSAGDNRNELWSRHSPMDHMSSSSNGLLGNHLYASMTGYAMEQPLVLTRNSLDIGVGSRDQSATLAASVERQQNRPSVITCAPASNRNCNLSHCHMNDCTPGPTTDERKANANTVCDPVIEEHFRRSLGKNYKETEPVSNSVSITGSVDDHFAKALGETWHQIKAQGGGQQTPDP